ncbi:hypothetical protein CCANI_02210 [Corynebacterium canis]|nr:hypothetical protein CCANI_02210 [Corynebacterium canis]
MAKIGVPELLAFAQVLFFLTFLGVAVFAFTQRDHILEQ